MGEKAAKRSKRNTDHFVPLGDSGAVGGSKQRNYHDENNFSAPVYGSGCFLAARSASAFVRISARARGSWTFL